MGDEQLTAGAVVGSLFVGNIPHTLAKEGEQGLRRVCAAAGVSGVVQVTLRTKAKKNGNWALMAFDDASLMERARSTALVVDGDDGERVSLRVEVTDRDQYQSSGMFNEVYRTHKEGYLKAAISSESENIATLEASLGEFEGEERQALERQIERLRQAAMGKDLKPTYVVLLGGPGAGKGTQVEKLLADPRVTGRHAGGVHAISTGELLRDRAAQEPEGSLLKAEIEEAMTGGALVSSDKVMMVLTEAVEALAQQALLILDGFPRTVDQCESLLEKWGAPRLGVFLELGEEEMQRRVLSRGAEGSGRADDNAEALVNRFRAFRAASMPVIELLEAKGMLSRVSSEASPDEVYRELAALFGEADLAQPRSTSTVAKTGFWASCCGRRSDTGGDTSAAIRNPLTVAINEREEDEDDEDICARISRLAGENPGNIALNTFDAEYYGSLRSSDRRDFLRCLNSGIENPDSQMGCYACQPEDYDRFKPFFSKALAKYHKVPADSKHVNDWSLVGVQGLPAGGMLDLSALGLPELSMRVRVGRNLKAFPLPGAMSKTERCNMENFMLKAFEQLIDMPEYGGKYCSFTPGHPHFVNEQEYQKLVDAHIAFKDMSADTYLLSAGIAQDWPHGRGVYISEDSGFIIWCGEEDHLRIMCMEKGSKLNTVFDRLKNALDVVNGIEGLEFAISRDYGVVTSCPTNLGTGMRASLHIQLPNLTADGTDAKAKEIAKPLGLSVRGLGGEHTPIGADGTVDISPSARFCITEAQIITALYKGIAKLKQAEDSQGG